MAKNWRNLGFVAKFWTKFALFDERKMAFWRQNPLEPKQGLLGFASVTSTCFSGKTMQLMSRREFSAPPS